MGASLTHGKADRLSAANSRAGCDALGIVVLILERWMLLAV